MGAATGLAYFRKLAARLTYSKARKKGWGAGEKFAKRRSWLAEIQTGIETGISLL
jgi:hypothetical protein